MAPLISPLSPITHVRCGLCHGGGMQWRFVVDGPDDRIYDRFAVLGMMGNRRPEIVRPWPLRGLPIDQMSEESRQLDDVNIHSTSWLGLDELLALDWDAHGCVRDEQEKQADGSYSWVAGVAVTYRRLVGSDFLEFLHRTADMLGGDYRALDAVAEDALEEAKHGKVHAELDALVERRRAMRAMIRLVFGFDS